MEQLKIKDVLNIFSKLKKIYTEKEILEMPIYIGDDDELNGIHHAWFCQLVVTNDKKEDKYIIELLNNIEDNNFKNKIILIS